MATLPLSAGRRTLLLEIRGWIDRPALRRAALPALCLLPVLLTARFWFDPVQRDEGVYAVIARGILHGEVPYRDLFDHKPPVIYGWYVASFLVFGDHDYAPRILGALALAATTGLTYVAGAALISRRAGLAAAGVFACSTGLAQLSPGTNVEPFLLVPLMGSLAAYGRWRVTANGRWLLVSGLLGGLAVATKQVAFFNVAVPAGDLGLRALTDRDARRATAGLLAMYAGSAAAAAAAVLAPLLVAGAAKELVYANLTYNRLYNDEVPASLKLQSGLHNGLSFLGIAAALVLLALPALLSMFGRHREANDRLILVWLLASFAGVALTGRFYAHYFVQLLPALALVAAVGVEHRPALLQSRLGAAAFALLFAGALAANVGGVSDVYSAPTGAGRAVAYDPGVGGLRAGPAREIGRQLAALSEPTDQVFVWGRETQIYYYANREPATRFLFDQPLALDPANLDEVLGELRSTPPRFLLDTSAGELDDNPEPFHPEGLESLLREQYVYLERIGFADVYIRRDPATN